MASMNEVSTIDAAKQLQDKARVIWVPVGGGVPTGLIDELANKPLGDHVVTIDSFGKMDRPRFLNKVSTDACPVVG